MAGAKGNKSNTIKKKKRASVANSKKTASEGKTVNNRTQSRIRRNKEKILEALESNMGIVTGACKKVGISTKTFYQWLKKDTEFARKVDEIEWGQRYYVESKLMRKIANDDTASIIFYLKCNHPNYKIKSEIDLNDTKALEKIRKDYGDLIKKIKNKRHAQAKATKNTG